MVTSAAAELEISERVMLFFLGNCSKLLKLGIVQVKNWTHTKQLAPAAFQQDLWWYLPIETNFQELDATWQDAKLATLGPVPNT